MWALCGAKLTHRVPCRSRAIFGRLPEIGVGALTTRPPFLLCSKLRWLCTRTVLKEDVGKETWQAEQQLRRARFQGNGASESGHGVETPVTEMEQREAAVQLLLNLRSSGDTGSICTAASEVSPPLLPTVLRVAVDDLGLDRFTGNELAILLSCLARHEHWTEEDAWRLRKVLHLLPEHFMHIRRDLLVKAMANASRFKGLDVFPLLQSFLEIYFVQLHRLLPAEFQRLAMLCSEMRERFAGDNYETVRGRLFNVFVNTLSNFNTGQAVLILYSLSLGVCPPAEQLRCLDIHFSTLSDLKAAGVSLIATAFTLMDFHAQNCSSLFKSLLLSGDLSELRFANVVKVFHQLCFAGEVETDILKKLSVMLPDILRREPRPFCSGISMFTAILAKAHVRSSPLAKVMGLMVTNALGESCQSVANTKDCCYLLRNLNILDVCSQKLVTDLFNRIASDLQVNMLSWSEMGQFMYGLALALERHDLSTLLLKRLSHVLAGNTPVGQLDELDAAGIIVGMGKLRWIETRWLRAVIEYIIRNLATLVTKKAERLQYLLCVICHLNRSARYIFLKLDELGAVPIIYDSIGRLTDRITFTAWLVHFNIWPLHIIENVMLLLDRQVKSLPGSQLLTVACLNAMIARNADARKFALQGQALKVLRNGMVERLGSRQAEVSCLKEMMKLLQSRTVCQNLFTAEGLLIDLVFFIEPDNFVSVRQLAEPTPWAAVEAGLRPAAVLVRSSKWFARNSHQPLGNIAMYCHVLRGLGWEVLLIPAIAWRHASDRIVYLRNQLRAFGVIV